MQILANTHTIVTLLLAALTLLILPLTATADSNLIVSAGCKT